MDKNLPKQYSAQQFYFLIKQKNQIAFDVLYDTYSSLLYGIAIRSIMSTELVDKIIELTFINAWRSIKDWKPEQKLLIWLINIFINTTKNYLDSQNIKYNLKLDFPNFYFETEDFE